MRNLLPSSVLCVVVVVGSAAGAAAQPPRPPLANPYLSLTGDPSTVAGNYYGIVRPQLALRNNLQFLQGEVAGIAAVGPGAMAPPGPLTGAPRAGYMTHQRYFLNSGAGLVRSPFAPFAPR